MSQDRAQTRVSLKQNATLSAYRIVRVAAANKVGLFDTATSNILGVTYDDGSNVGDGGAVDVVIAGTAKVQLAGSVAAGALVGPEAATTSGLGVAVTNPGLAGSATATLKSLGVALESGSTNSVIEVVVAPVNNAILTD